MNTAVSNPSESAYNVLDSRHSKSSFSISSVSHPAQDPKLPQEGSCHEVSMSLFGSETHFDKPSISSSDLHTSTEQHEASSTSEDRNYQNCFDNPSQPSSSLSDLQTSHEQYGTCSSCEDRNYQDGPVSQVKATLSVSSSFSSSVHNIKCLGGLSPTRPLHRVDPHLSPALHPNSNICSNTRPHIVSPPSVSPSRIQLGTTGRVPSMSGSSSEFETTNSILPCSVGTNSVPCNLPDNVSSTPDLEILLNGVEVCDVTNKTVTDVFFQFQQGLVFSQLSCCAAKR